MKPKSNYMPPEQFQLLLDNVHILKLRKFSIEDVQMLFKVARYCGLRINEVCKLTAEDFDLELKEIDLHKTKTHRNDKASIPSQFVEELRNYLEDRSGKIFPTNRHTVHYWLEVLGKSLDIPALTTPQSETGEKTKCHIFRKSIGKDMLNQKIPLNIIMKKLRHNHLETTSNYLKLNLEDVKKAEEDFKI